MSTIGSITIGFGVGVQQLKAGMSSASVVLQSASTGWANLGGAVTAARGAIDLVGGSVRAATGLITDMVMAASDLSEAQNLVEVQFGSGASIVTAAAQEMADKFGIVKSEFLQGAGNLGVVVEAMGQGETATASMSVELAKLAGDLASIRNMRFEDVMVGLRAGLGGEAEPLKNLGIFLNDATTKQEAYRAGIAKTGKELTDGQKIQARYNIIMAQTLKAQGDLERTAGGVANSVKGVSGRIENLKADVGGAFTTISQVLIASIGGAVVDIADRFGDVRTAVKQWADNSVQYGGIVSEAMGFIGEAVARLVDGVNLVRGVFVTAQAAIVQVLATAVQAAATWLELLDEGLRKSEKAIRATALLSGGAASAGATLGGALSKGLLGDQGGGPGLIERAKTMAASLQDAAATQWDAADAVKAQAGAGDRVRGVFDQIRARMDELGAASQAATTPLVANTAMAAANVEKAAKVQFGGALEMGSAEARSAVLSARVNKVDPAGKEQVALQKDANDLHRQAVAELKAIAGAFNFQVARI